MSAFFHVLRLRLGAALLLSHLLCSMTVNADTQVDNWLKVDVGNPAIPGSLQIEEGKLTLTSGGGDIWNSQDQFFFVNTQISGDASLTVRVNSIFHSHPWAKAALMFRESLAAGAKNVALDFSAHQRVAYQWRPITDQRSYYWARHLDTSSAWLRLVREGNTFTGYYSLDGETWQTAISKTLLDMPHTLYLGLAASSHDESAATQAEFEHLELKQTFNTRAKVYLMAGQSNMQGHGSIGDLEHTSGADLTGQRDDVFIKTTISNTQSLSGLKPGFGANSRTYGPELKFGNLMGEVLAEKVYLFKGAQGGTTLDNPDHWRPQSHGGNENNLYARLISGFKDFLATDLAGEEYEVAGFIWFQGYNDTFGTEHQYETHLRNLISAVRTDLALPKLPVVITQINDNRGAAGDIVMAAQANIADEDALASLVYTADQRPYYHYGNDSYVVIGKRMAQAALESLNYGAARDDEYTLAMGQPLSVTSHMGVLANDVADLAELVTDVRHGNLIFNSDGSFVYTPDPSFKGQDGFSYQVKRNGRVSNQAQVRLWVREPADDLVMHFDFEGADVNDIRDSASGIQAIVERPGISLGHAGVEGNGAYFDGSTVLHYMVQYPEYPFLNLWADNSFSFSAWVKPDVGISGEQILISNKYFYNRGSGFAITTNSNGKGIRAYISSYDHVNHQTQTLQLSGGDTQLDDGQWHKVAAEFDAVQGKVRLYLDQQLVAEASASHLVGEINKYECAIGDGAYGGDGSSSAFKGYMDEVKWFNGANVNQGEKQ